MNPEPTQAEIDELLEDPLIDEIRAIRRELSERFNNDPALLAAHVRQVGEQWRREREARQNQQGPDDNAEPVTPE